MLRLWRFICKFFTTNETKQKKEKMKTYGDSPKVYVSDEEWANYCKDIKR